MKNLKWLMLGGLVLLVSVANADYNVLDKGTHYQNAPTGLRTNQTGDLRVEDMDRDRDYPVVTNAFTGIVLNQQTTWQTPNAIDLTKYSRATLMLSYAYAAAADSDSTFIGVRIYGKTSSSSSVLHLWTPLGTSVAAGDTCQCNSTALADSLNSQHCITPAPSFVVIRGGTDYRVTTKVLGQFIGMASGRGTLRKIPAYAIRYGGSQGVLLNLSDSAGNPFPFPYAIIEVFNMSFTRNLTSVSCDIWPRVN